jgi:hypothetical protein
MVGKRGLESWAVGFTHPGNQSVNPPLHCICVWARRALEHTVSLRQVPVIALTSVISRGQDLRSHHYWQLPIAWGSPLPPLIRGVATAGGILQPTEVSSYA